MIKLGGFYCFDNELDLWVNDPAGSAERVTWEQAQPRYSIEECQRVKDERPQLQFLYLPEPGCDRRELIPVPLFPSPDHEVITDS